jgi:dipeptidyl aminopeptidase/acylaminoacyl peptidase
VAVAQGIADEKRVCIYGASYGGYATMAGLTFTPEVYKCGINYVGVTDIPLLFTSMPKTWEPQKDIMKIQIGNPDTPEGRKLLDEQSPLNYVDNIKAPLFIVQGMRDIRVVPKHAEMLRDELKERGRPPEWLHKYNEGHGFRKEENRLELYARIDAFLAKNL